MIRIIILVISCILLSACSTYSSNYVSYGEYIYAPNIEDCLKKIHIPFKYNKKGVYVRERDLDYAWSQCGDGL